MPPIRTFKSAPINPHSAGNTSTSTSETPEQPRQEDEEQDTDTVTEQRKDGPAWTPATMTANVDESYPAARPGAPAMPAPTSTSTSSSVYTPTRTYPSSTTTTDSSSTPPPPQPGARPVPPSSATTTTAAVAAAPTGRSAVPPPPKVGEPLQPASYYAPPPLRQHQQQAIPNSTSTPYLSTYQPPTSYSSTNLAGAGSGPGLALSQHAGQSNSSSGGSVFDAALGEGTTGQDILNTAKSWMASAGNKLAEAEEEVWKMVNKKT